MECKDKISFNGGWAVLETLDSLILFASTSSDSDSENHDSNKKKYGTHSRWIRLR